MDFGLSEDQLLLKETVRRYLAEKCPTTRVREIMEGETGHDETLWSGLAELGITGLSVPAEHGGLEHELLDLALVSEEFGYAATPGPFLGHALATLALVESDDAELQKRWLPALASGEALATLAVGEEDGEWRPDRLTTAATGDRLTGNKPLVPYAAAADIVLVAARDDAGVGLWLVEKDASGKQVNPLKGVDMTRRLDALDLSDAPARKVRGGEIALARAFDAGLILLAADAYGGSRRCLEMTGQYALTREQFGQIIGAFQAVKHQIANMACELEPAMSLYWYAAHAHDHIRDQAPRHASLAKAHLTDIYDRIVRDATELHGGIGFTWEFDLHLWFRRSIFDRCFLGDASLHKARAADLAGW